MGHVGLAEILVIILIVVLLFGAKKLPEIGSALGKAIKAFKKAGTEENDSTDDARDNEQNPTP